VIDSAGNIEPKIKTGAYLHFKTLSRLKLHTVSMNIYAMTFNFFYIVSSASFMGQVGRCKANQSIDASWLLYNNMFLRQLLPCRVSMISYKAKPVLPTKRIS